MQMKLKDELNQFKDLTIILIEALKNESYDELENLFQLRQKVMEKIDRTEHTTEEFKGICEELRIIGLQDELTSILAEKKQAAKYQLDKFLDNKNANKSYNSKFSADSLYFNKKF